MLIVVLIAAHAPGTTPIIVFNALLLVVLTLRVALSDCIRSYPITIQEVLAVLIILDLATRHTTALFC